MTKPRLLVYRSRSDSSLLGDELEQSFDVNYLTFENGHVDNGFSDDRTSACAAFVVADFESPKVASKVNSGWELSSDGEQAVRERLKAVWNSLVDLLDNWNKDDRGCQVLIALPPVLPWLASSELLAPYLSWHALVGFIRALSSAEDHYSFRINGLIRQNPNPVVFDKLCSYLLSYSANWVNGYIFAVLGNEIVLLTQEEPIRQIFLSDTTNWSSGLHRWQLDPSYRGETS
jgi:hypothetical protein